MSILDHVDPSHSQKDEIPRFKESCCMKYTLEEGKQCKRCPFRQISDESAQEKAKSVCWDRRRGHYTWYDENNDVELRIEYNNQYR